jgi:uncharacterized protein (TIGR02453 family)
MAFSGWPAEALKFFEDLEADNSKAYWTAHKAVYEDSVRAPMAELLDELAGEFGPGRIARPYRDVRFSPDKSPYKTSIYAILEDGGYVNFSADGLVAGIGYYQMAPDQLDRYRHAVADDSSGAELVGIIERLTAGQVEVGGSSSLKSAPRGYPKDHPRIELLRHRGLIAWRHWPAAPWLHTAAAKQRVVKFLRLTAPLHAWLDDHVGPTTAPSAAR